MENFIDEEIRNAMWNSKIPIKIDMAIEDVNDVELPNSLYVNNHIKNKIIKNLCSLIFLD
jgi:hypothetical protein